MNPIEPSSIKIIDSTVEHGFKEITIIGSGFVGGSIAHAAHSRGIKIHVWDPDEETNQLALHFGWKTYKDPSEAASKGELIIIASPVDTIVNMAKRIAPAVKDGAIVTDVGSVKYSISTSLAEIFKDRNIETIPGHPMAGKAVHGLVYADPNIFNEATWIFTDRTDSPALPRLISFARDIGARHFVSMDSIEHDKLVALISHVPQIVSTALATGLSSNDGFEDAIQLAGAGFRDTTRLASSPWLMWEPILKENRKDIIAPLTAVRDALNLIIDDLSIEKVSQIEDAFTQANKARESYDKLHNPL